MIREIIMTIMIIMTIEKTEDNVKTSNKTDKSCSDLQILEATCATSPLHSGPLLGNALKKISELTSTVDQQPCEIRR